MLERLSLKNFTVFHALDLTFSPMVNLFIGVSGTGKTHILKLLYAICEAHRFQRPLADKLLRVFVPDEDRLGRLVRRQWGGHSADVSITRDGKELSFQFSSNQGRDSFSELRDGWTPPADADGIPVFIPVKEMLAHSRGFRELYQRREIPFDETYRDILDHAFVPLTRGAVSAARREMLSKIETLIKGRVTDAEGQFYLESEQGRIEFPLVAEGFRKFGLLLRLIQNDTLNRSAILFWDEPEANINPLAIRELVGLLLVLVRQGVQLFLATHSDIVLKEFELQQRPGEVRYFALNEQAGEVSAESAEHYNALRHNAIEEENIRLYDEVVIRAIGGNPAFAAALSPHPATALR